MFGMMFPNVRKTTATQKNPKGFAMYRSPLDSIRDYFNWLRAFELTTDEQLLAHIKAGKYAQDPNYYKTLQRTVASISGDLVSPVTLGLGAAAGVGLTAAAFSLLTKKLG